MAEVESTERPATYMSRERTPLLPLMAFASPNGPMFALSMPMAIFIPPFFAGEMGLGLATVGAIFMAARFWDVFTDPAAGIVMDRLQSRIPRPRWLLLGCPIVMVGTYMLFFARAPVDWVYLLGWLLLFYTGWTLMITSLYSWAAELSMDYHERSRIMGALQIANVTGTVLVLIVPSFVEAIVGRPERIDILRINAMGLFVLLLMPLTVALSLRFAPKPPRRTPRPAGLGKAAKTILTNGPFLRLLAVEFGSGLSIGTTATLAVFFVETVLGHRGMAGTAMLVLLTSTLFAVPFWVHLAGRYSKHKTGAYAALVAIIPPASVFFLPPGNLPLLFVLFVGIGLTVGAGQFLPRAILADVVDQDRLQTGDERAGLFYAFMTTATKIGLAVAIGLSLILSDLFGFDPQAETVSDSAALGIRILIVAIPICVNLSIAWLLWRFPLDQAKQVMLRNQLEAGQKSGTP